MSCLFDQSHSSSINAQNYLLNRIIPLETFDLRVISGPTSYQNNQIFKSKQQQQQLRWNLGKTNFPSTQEQITSQTDKRKNEIICLMFEKIHQHDSENWGKVPLVQVFLIIRTSSFFKHKNYTREWIFLETEKVNFEDSLRKLKFTIKKKEGFE